MKTALYRYLDNLGACEEALEWVDDNSLNDPQTAWDMCPDARWLIWVVEPHLGKPGWPTRRELVLAACDCAETVAHLVPEDEDRLWGVLATVRRWARGKATARECEKAADKAKSAAVSTSYYDAHATRNVLAAYHAAYAAMRAAKAIEHSGGDYQKALAYLADIVRKRLYIGRVEL